MSPGWDSRLDPRAARPAPRYRLRTLGVAGARISALIAQTIAWARSGEWLQVSGGAGG